MRERVIGVGLVLFVIADVLLVTLAFRHVGTPRAAASAHSPHVTAHATKSAPSAFLGPIAFLSLRNDGTVLRASRGDCAASTAPDVMVSSDTGSTFAFRTVPGLREVVEAQVSPRRLELVGLGDRCRIARFASLDEGKSWTREAGDGPTWHLSRDRSSRFVHSPLGRRAVPCRPLSLSAAVPGPVRLLCLDGRIYGSDDTGATWPYLGRLRGAVDIDFAGPASGYALARLSDCPAAVMGTVDGGGSWAEITCLPGRTPRVIAAVGTVVAAQVDTHLFVSRDNGISWPGTRNR